MVCMPFFFLVQTALEVLWRIIGELYGDGFIIEF